MGSSKKLFGTIAIIMLGSWLLIDMINGFLLYHGIHLIGNISLGDAVRIMFIPILFLSIRIKRADLFFWSVPYLLLLLAFGQYYWLNKNLINNVSLVVKVSLPVLIYLFIKNNKYLRANPDVLKKVLYINIVILLFNIFVSYFGYGFANYTGSQNFGGTGYFYAGNEVAGLLIVIYSIVLYQFRDKPKKALLVSLLFFIAGIGLASKTALFGTLIIFCLYIYLYKTISRYLVVAFAVATTVLIYNLFSSYIALAVNRWQFFINNYGAIIYLTGGIKRWTAIGDYFSTLYTYPFLLLVGYGWQGIAEANLIDLAQAYGILGISIYFIWIYWGRRVYKKMQHPSDKKYAALVFFLIISVATLAGHIMQSAMTAPFVAILANLNYLEVGKPNEQDSNNHQRLPV